MHRKTHLKKKLCGLFCALLFFIVLGGLLSWGGVEAFTGSQKLIINLPQFYTNTVEPMLLDIFSKLERLEIWNNASLQKLFVNLETQIMDTLAGLAKSISTKAVGVVSSVATSLPGLFVKLILFIISTVFISMDYDKIMRFCVDQLSDHKRALFYEVKAYIVGTLFVVIRSYILIMSITFIELSIGLSIIGIKNVLIISLCIAVFDILPVLGVGGVLIPWAVICLVLGNFGLAASLGILYVIIVIVRNILEPKIVGSQLGLHPIVTLSSMFAGVQLLGGIGLFGFPITLSLLVHLDKKGVITIFRKK
jgi:sporulation integral membrane protein YtvI